MIIVILSEAKNLFSRVRESSVAESILSYAEGLPQNDAPKFCYTLHGIPDKACASPSGKSMLIEVEVTAGANSPLDLHRMFDLISEPRFISSVLTFDATGRDRWCDVTGWCESGVCPAQAALSEDSGEGVVLVVYGGDQGIRLKPTDCLESWDLASPHQWGEACLLLDKDAPFTLAGKA